MPAVAARQVVTLHLWAVRPSRVPAAVARMAVDRVWLSRVAGLEFWKLLGTGDGRTFTLRDADPLHWGLLGVWRDAGALEAFEREGRTASAWRRLAEEAWRGDLACLRTRGFWAGRAPFQPAGLVGWEGPVAAITRARLAPSRALRFWRAVPPVVADLHGSPGLRLSVGIGEAPVGLQGTFSVWASAASLTDFAYRGAAHRAVADATPGERWYTEELFARFALLGGTGTLFGQTWEPDA